MSLIDEYLNTLKTYFDEDDAESFDSLKEDLIERWEECLLEGMTEEEAIATFSSPKTIAKDYFRDRSFEIAEKAKTYVVPKEEVKSFFYQSQKYQWKKVVNKLVNILKEIMRLVLLTMIGVSLYYIVKEIYYEQHIAKIPLMSLLVSTLSLLFYVSKKRKNILILKMTLFGIAVLVFFVSQFQNDWFYTGIDYYHKFDLKKHENLDFSLDIGPNIEVSTVSVPKEDSFELILRGKYTKQDIQQLEKQISGNKVNISLNPDSWHNLFTSNGRKEVILFVPEKKILSYFNVISSKGDLRLLDFETKKLKIDLEDGELYMKEVSVDEGEIRTSAADFILDESQGNLNIDNKHGKNVITKFEGDLDIRSNTGISILKQLDSQKVNLNSKKSRLIIDNSSVTQLNVSATGGQQVVKNTTGDIHIKTEEGRIVTEELKGKLELQTFSGPIISIQTSAVDANVCSQKGFIKCLQSDSDEVLIDAYVGKKKIKNDFSNTINPKTKVKINSETGTVKVIKKID